MTRTHFDDARMPGAAPCKVRRVVLVVLAAACVQLVACGQRDAGDSVSLEAARAEFEAGRAILIDIREPGEHATGVAAGAQLLPMRQIKRRMSEIPATAGKPVLLICHTQNRSSATLRALREQGFAHVRFVQGGMSEWVRRGWPVVKPAQLSGLARCVPGGRVSGAPLSAGVSAPCAT